MTRSAVEKALDQAAAASQATASTPVVDVAWPAGSPTLDEALEEPGDE